MRRLYILLLRLHPKTFRQRFGDEMLGIFDDSAEKAALLSDGLLSVFRQWALRQPATELAATSNADGVPVFYSAAPEMPSGNALVRGAFVAMLGFVSFFLIVSHRWQQTTLIVGSHHPSPSHILGAHTDAQPVKDLPAEVKMKPYPDRPPISPYFRLMLVLAALDADQDNIISVAEIANAPAALWTLDKNNDGQLTAEECGFKPDSNLDRGQVARARRTFMRVHPVLAVLDANQDGVISSSEIRNAAASLRLLDANGDGKLVERELVPDRGMAMAAGIMDMLDKNGDGKLTPDEIRGAPAALTDLVRRADQDRKGFVTEDDLVRAEWEMETKRPTP